jgi:hypothetical protein
MSDVTATHIYSTNSRLRGLELIVLGWTKALAIGLVIIGGLIPFATESPGQESEASYSLWSAAVEFASAEAQWLADSDVIRGYNSMGIGILALLLCTVVGTIPILALSVIDNSSRKIVWARIASLLSLLATGAVWAMLMPFTDAFSSSEPLYSFLGPSLITIGVVVAVVAAYSPAYVEMG